MGNIIPIKANANSSESTDYTNVGGNILLNDNLNIYNTNTESIFDAMTDEAKTIFIRYMQTMDGHQKLPMYLSSQYYNSYLIK